MQNTNFIKATREQSGKTQQQVARESGVGIRNYQSYEYGAQTPNVVTAIRIAKALNTTVEKLWDYNIPM